MARYLLDANTLSEQARPRPHAQLLARLSMHQGQLATATVVLHELAFGIERIPSGHRKSRLTRWLDEVQSASIELLPYDQRAALWHARERARLEAEGQTAPFVDSQVAAVAAVNQLTLVTRNVKDFQRFEGLRVVDWCS